MCEPTTWVAIASTVISTGVQIQQSRAQTATAEAEAQTAANEFAASRDVELSERQKQARRERARIRVSAGESGVAGASLDAQLKNSFGQENQNVAIAVTQSAFTERRLNADAEANSGNFGALQGGLQIAGGVASAYGAQQRRRQIRATSQPASATASGTT